MKRNVVVAAAALFCGCAPAATGGAETGTVRATTTISGAGGTRTVESYSSRVGSAATIQAPVDRVWEALPAVYQALGIPMGTSVPASRTFGNTGLEVSRTLAGRPVSTWLDCGSGPFGAPLADTYRVNASVVTTLAPGADGQTQLTTMVSGTATNRATSGAPVNCGTTGALETQIAERVRQVVGTGTER